MRSTRRRTVGAVVGLVMLTAAFVPWSSELGTTAAARDMQNDFWPAKGVKLTRIRHDQGPQEIRVLTINPSRGPRIDIATAGQKFPMYKWTSGMSASIGAVAGVNGDFATSYGAPSHATMVDGEIWTTGTTGGDAFGVSTNGQRAFIGYPKPRTMVRPIRSTAEAFPVTQWNAGPPTPGDVAAYTARGGSVVTPPGSTNPTGSDPAFCAARLVPLKGSGLSWTDNTHRVIARRYRVTYQPEPCQKKPMSIGTHNGTVVISARADMLGGPRVKSLQRGNIVKLAWWFEGWPGVTDVVGGNPLLIDHKKSVAVPYDPSLEYLYNFNPRTAVGIKPGCSDKSLLTVCKIYILTDDGRQAQSGWSKGYQFPGLAAEFMKLGVSFAMNLDGGGSTTMWVKNRRPAYCQTPRPFGGCVVNRPSQSGGERATIEALVVLPGPDPGNPAGLN